MSETKTYQDACKQAARYCDAPTDVQEGELRRGVALFIAHLFKRELRDVFEDIKREVRLVPCIARYDS